jgi:hypothetical protein
MSVGYMKENLRITQVLKCLIICEGAFALMPLLLTYYLQYIHFRIVEVHKKKREA